MLVYENNKVETKGIAFTSGHILAYGWIRGGGEWEEHGIAGLFLCSYLSAHILNKCNKINSVLWEETYDLW